MLSIFPSVEANGGHYLREISSILILYPLQALHKNLQPVTTNKTAVKVTKTTNMKAMKRRNPKNHLLSWEETKYFIVFLHIHYIHSYTLLKIQYTI